MAEEGHIREFTVSPDCVKVGYEDCGDKFFKSQIEKGLRENAGKFTSACLQMHGDV